MDPSSYTEGRSLFFWPSFVFNIIWEGGAGGSVSYEEEITVVSHPARTHAEVARRMEPLRCCAHPGSAGASAG